MHEASHAGSPQTFDTQSARVVHVSRYIFTSGFCFCRCLAVTKSQIKIFYSHKTLNGVVVLSKVKIDSTLREEGTVFK